MGNLPRLNIICIGNDPVLLTKWCGALIATGHRSVFAELLSAAQIVGREPFDLVIMSMQIGEWPVRQLMKLIPASACVFPVDHLIMPAELLQMAEEIAWQIAKGRQTMPALPSRQIC